MVRATGRTCIAEGVETATQFHTSRCPVVRHTEAGRSPTPARRGVRPPPTWLTSSSSRSSGSCAAFWTDRLDKSTDVPELPSVDEPARVLPSSWKTLGAGLRYSSSGAMWPVCSTSWSSRVMMRQAAVMGVP